MSERVIVSIKDHVAEVRLNRADKLNALDMPMIESLAAAADRLAGERSVRAVVLHGAGKHFCTGIDLAVFSDPDLDFADALNTPLDPSPANIFQRAAYAWRELPIPVICALQGVAFGGGLQVAIAADVRYAAPDVQLSIMEAKWGIIPDMGLTTTLRHLLAPDQVKELAWTARVIDSSEALKLGLVTAVRDEPLAAARELAATIAGQSPDAVRGIKRLVNCAWEMSEDEALALESQLQGGIIGGRNQREAVAANLAGRRPDFKD